MLNSGEVPNLFGVDEKADICEKMRVIDRQKDKSQQVCSAFSLTFHTVLTLCWVN